MARLPHLIVVAAILSINSLPAAAFFDLFDRRHVEPNDRLPHCEDSNVHRIIAHRFSYADRDYYRGIDSIDSFDRVTEVALDAGRPSPLARRYCRARVAMSDQRTRTLYYMIEEDASFVSWSWGVEFCIRGLDRWRIYDGRCRTVRP